jgi:type I restriction enzyme R subunit
MKFAESVVEDACLSWLSELGFSVVAGPDIAPGEPTAERDLYEQTVLAGRLRSALSSLNPTIPADCLHDVMRRLQRQELLSLVQSNRLFHRWLVEGVPVEYRLPDGGIKGDLVRLVDFDHPDANDWLAVNQFTVVENKVNRRADVVLFVNGLPLVVMELKNPADEKATIWSAFNQLQTYKHQIPNLMRFNEALVITDGTEARIGSLTADKERFMPWRTIEGEQLAPAMMPQLEVLIKGAFDKRRFLDMIRSFVVFRDGDGEPVKIMAAYHQYHAVQTAVERTLEATRPSGDRRCGVVWHTQGSGKSLTMAFYAGRIIAHPAMENPTLVVLTDRNDLDDQLFATFHQCHELLRQEPVQAQDRQDLQRLLNVASGGVIFTTIQKFLPETTGDQYPLLSDRRNIVVIADEAHRSQYDFVDGFARHMRDALPHASFIGFTGTPIERADKNTYAVFGDCISVYDIQRSVEDGATVPIYYEGRLAKLELVKSERPHLDADFEEVTEGEEEQHKERLKSKWAALEAVAGAEKRIQLVAQDLVDHWEQRLMAMDGKAMIVCMSRRICVELYNAIIKLRPAWADPDDTKGVLKIVMTGAAADPLDWQQHIRNKQGREALAKRFKDPADPLKLVIVRDMWLTGFDVPCLTTMYVDKPMRGHGLMQAIARVNRVFRDKPGGLIVDYLGLADQLRQALATYTENGGRGTTALDQEVAVTMMMEKYEVCRGLFHGFDWNVWTTGTPQQRVSLLPAAQEHILAQEDGKNRLIDAVVALTKAFALSVPNLKALAIGDDVAFFQAVRAVLSKSTGGGAKPEEDLDHAIRQIVSRAVASDGVVDIFDAAGLKKPDISILSEEFLEEVRTMPQKNLAVETLRKLLNDEIHGGMRKNVVRARSFGEMLERSIRAYQNHAIETAQVIEQLIELARQMRDAQQKGKDLGLTEDEIAFYDALGVNDSAVKVLGDEELKKIAQELVATLRKNVSIDWTVKDSVKARLRLEVKKVLRHHHYPPDKQEQATKTVLEQAERSCADWAEE